LFRKKPVVHDVSDGLGGRGVVGVDAVEVEGSWGRGRRGTLLLLLLLISAAVASQDFFELK